jgi:hypothetical protein
MGVATFAGTEAFLNEALEVRDLTRLGAVDDVSEKLNEVASHEKGRREKEDGEGSQAEDDGYEERADDRHRDADHVEEEADRMAMALEPVLDNGCRRMGRAEHRELSRSAGGPEEGCG